MKSGDVDHGGILGDPETKQMWAPGEELVE